MGLFEVECGYRQPLDGQFVTEAIQTALLWGGVYGAFSRTQYPGHGGGLPQSATDEIGEWHQSGRKLPTSRFEANRILSDLGQAAEVGGADEDRAVCQPKPDQSVGDFILELMQYDPYTFLWYGTDGRFQYRNVFEITVTHWMTETEQGVLTPDPSPAPEGGLGEGGTPLDVMRAEFTHRAGEGEKKTAVLVTGKDRASGEPLRAYLADIPAMTEGATKGFVGYERLERIQDDKLNTQGMVNLRCIWEYEAQRAWEDRVNFGCLGQPEKHPLEYLVPDERRSRGGWRTYVIVAVRDSVGKTGEYTGQIDAVDVDALKGLAGKATGTA